MTLSGMDSKGVVRTLQYGAKKFQVHCVKLGRVGQVHKLLMFYIMVDVWEEKEDRCERLYVCTV